MAINVTGPACPECGALVTKVVATKRDLSDKFFVRRRYCEFCLNRFYTAQPQEALAKVRWTGGGSSSIPIVEAA